MHKLEISEKLWQFRLLVKESTAEKSRISAGLTELADHPSISENNLILSYYVCFMSEGLLISPFPKPLRVRHEMKWSVFFACKLCTCRKAQHSYVDVLFKKKRFVPFRNGSDSCNKADSKKCSERSLMPLLLSLCRGNTGLSLMNGKPIGSSHNSLRPQLSNKTRLFTFSCTKLQFLVMMSHCHTV